MYHVVYCFDINYQQHFAASLESLVKNFSKDPSLLFVHIISDNVSDKLRDFIKKFSRKSGINIEINILTPEQFSILDVVPAKFRKIKGYINISTYFRLMIPILISEQIRKIVYIDSDTIVVSDISELYQVELSGKSMGAVLDVDNKYMSEIHGLSEYYNAGLLVMRLDALRSNKFFERAIGYISGENCGALMGDQCAINIAMSGDICAIPEKWNRYASNTEFSIAEADERIKGAALIHFITAHKPWHAWFANKLGDLYWNSLRASQWPDPVLRSPETVNEFHFMARKLRKRGDYVESIDIYERLVEHLLKKLDGLRSGN